MGKKQSIEDIHLGEEPEPKEAELSKSELITALNWYNYFKDQNFAQKQLVQYFKSDKETVQRIKSFPTTKIQSTYGFIARMLNRGFILPEKVVYQFHEYVRKNFTEPKKADVIDIQTGERTSPQKLVKQYAKEYCGEIDEVIDQFIINNCKTDFKCYDYLKRHDVKPMYASKIAEHFQELLDELNESFTDQDLKEGYSNFTKPQMQRYISFVDGIINDCNTWASNNKKPRKPRKKKAKKVSQLVNKLQYKERDDDLKIASVNPEKIIGAQQVWLYNTKYKKLTVLYAVDAAGLGVKGTTINNFDEKTSVTKVLRKPSETLNTVQKGGKVALKKIMTELRTKAQEAKGRCGEQTVIMRVL